MENKFNVGIVLTRELIAGWVYHEDEKKVLALTDEQMERIAKSFKESVENQEFPFLGDYADDEIQKGE